MLGTGYDDQTLDDLDPERLSGRGCVCRSRSEMPENLLGIQEASMPHYAPHHKCLLTVILL